jgi:hypothetical protein
MINITEESAKAPSNKPDFISKKKKKNCKKGQTVGMSLDRHYQPYRGSHEWACRKTFVFYFFFYSSVKLRGPDGVDIQLAHGARVLGIEPCRDAAFVVAVSAG